MKLSKMFFVLIACGLIGGGLFANDVSSQDQRRQMPAPCYQTSPHGAGMPGMMAPPRGYTPEQRAKYETLQREFRDRTLPLQEKLFVKRHELDALKKASPLDVSAVRTAASDLFALRTEMRKELDAFRTKIEEEVGRIMPQKRPGKRPVEQ